MEISLAIATVIPSASLQPRLEPSKTLLELSSACEHQEACGHIAHRRKGRVTYAQLQQLALGPGSGVKVTF
ncbi:MAG TPA: hypothetical protein VME66_04170 [Candidatus Acidoferrales bacterium]|nr:hypothetical protein [Candidatus Acidoferrales bacterium]